MNHKISEEEKAKAAILFLTGKKSAISIGASLGVDRKQIYRWAKVYEKAGIQGFTRHQAKRRNKKNNKYSPELKMAAVTAYLSGEGSQKEICKRYGILSNRQLQNWLKVYNAHGDFKSVKQSGGGSYMKQGRGTTKEERLEIVKDCLASGKNYGEMAQKYKVSYQQVRTWTLRFEEMGEAGLEDRRGKRKKDQTPRTELEAAQIEIERLKHQLYMAEMERDLLKKLDEIERRDASHK